MIRKIIVCKNFDLPCDWRTYICMRHSCARVLCFLRAQRVFNSECWLPAVTAARRAARCALIKPSTKPMWIVAHLHEAIGQRGMLVQRGELSELHPAKLFRFCVCVAISV